MLSLPILLLLSACTNSNSNPVTVNVNVESSDCCCCDGADDCDDTGDTGAPGDTGDTGSECHDWHADEPEFEPIECEAEPDPVPLDPEVIWAWPPSREPRKYDNVMVTPVVGDVDNDGRPEVVVTAYFGTSYNNAVGALVVLDGVTGAEELYITSLIIAGTSVTVPSRAGVALGDLTGDGTDEICVSGMGSVVVFCVDALGVGVMVATTGVVRPLAYPVIADLNYDGTAEVILGNHIYDASGGLLGVGGAGWAGGASWAIPTAADMDGDGLDLEVVVGNAIYDRLGATVVSAAGVNDGLVAVAELTGDSSPDVVTVSNGTVWVWDGLTGAVSATWTLADGGMGGAPTIADFMGDGGVPEIGIASYYFYYVFKPDGTLVWAAPIYDYSAGTGSSVFDFEGDGVAEVVYASENAIHVFAGPTGTDLMTTTGGFDPNDHGSATSLEYPSLADVNLDGSTDILLASNDTFTTGWYGVRAIGSASASWAPSRSVWNQHAYSITNINDDLTIPAPVSANWLTYNNFRVADDGSFPVSLLPNLTVGRASWCREDCGDTVEVWFTVYNNGQAPSGPVVVEILDPSVIHTETVNLAPGAWAYVGPVTVPVGTNVTLTIDGANLVTECNEGDNDGGPWAVVCEE